LGRKKRCTGYRKEWVHPIIHGDKVCFFAIPRQAWEQDSPLLPKGESGFFEMLNYTITSFKRAIFIFIYHPTFYTIAGFLKNITRNSNLK